MCIHIGGTDSLSLDPCCTIIYFNRGCLTYPIILFNITISTLVKPETWHALLQLREARKSGHCREWVSLIINDWLYIEFLNMNSDSIHCRKTQISPVSEGVCLDPPLQLLFILYFRLTILGLEESISFNHYV